MRDFLDAKIEERKKAAGYEGRKIGVGVIGLHEGRTLLVALGRTAHAYAAAGCDLDQEKIEQARRDVPDIFYTTDYDTMLARPDVDVVAIYTPDAYHGRHILRAFEAGKSVICTKPLVNSMADARAVLEAARRTKQKLLVGQSTRFFEPFRRQRRDFEAGLMGDVELADAHYIHRMDWYYKKSAWVATDTDWIFLGLSHPVDLVCWYLGRIEEVHAYGYTSALGKHYGSRSNDVLLVNLRGENGKIGRAMGHYGLHELPGARNCIELFLCGTGQTSLAQYHDMRYLHTSPDGTEIHEDPLYELRHYYFNSEIHGMHYGEFANYADVFASALLKGTQYSPDLNQGIETFCVMEAIRRSIESGLPVKVAPLLHEAGL